MSGGRAHWIALRAASVGVFLLSAAGARACVVPIIKPSGGLPHPLCKIPVALSEEKVVVLTALKPTSKTNLRGADFRKEAGPYKIVDVTLKPSAQPLYIVTHSYDPVIWRFRGAVSSISRIISLGSDFEGYKAVGYIGAPNEKIHFVAPLPNSNVATARSGGGVPSIEVNICFYWSRACRPDDYAYRLSDPNKTAVVKALIKKEQIKGLPVFGELTGMISPPQDAPVMQAGVLPPRALEAPEFVTLGIETEGASASFSDHAANAENRESTTNPVALDPAEVFSPMSFTVTNETQR